MVAPRAVAASLALVVLLGSACSGSAAPRRTVTKFVDPSTPVTSSSASSTSVRPTTPPPSTPAAMSKLPGTCDDLLPQGAVEDAMNETLQGDTAFVVGQPDRSIHRVTYINCRYGLSDPSATPAVEVQVSLYGTAAQAVARITATVRDYAAHGANSQDASAGGIPAKILTGGSGADYSTPTIVLAFGQRTVAVSLDGSVPASRQQDALTALAVLAVRRTQ